MSDPEFEERLAALQEDIRANYRLASGRLTGGNGGRWSSFKEAWENGEPFWCTGCGRAIPCRHCPEDTEVTYG